MRQGVSNWLNELDAPSDVKLLFNDRASFMKHFPCQAQIERAAQVGEASQSDTVWLHHLGGNTQKWVDCATSVYDQTLDKLTKPTFKECNSTCWNTRCNTNGELKTLRTELEFAFKEPPNEPSSLLMQGPPDKHGTHFINNGDDDSADQ